MAERTKKVIQQIAWQHGVTLEDVEANMKEAIRAGMASRDPHAQALWKQIAPDGKEPTIERFLEFCINRVKTYTKE